MKLLRLLMILLTMLLVGGCQVATNDHSHNSLHSIQKMIIRGNYEQARQQLLEIYSERTLRYEKGETMYWIAITYIKQSNFVLAEKYLIGANEYVSVGVIKGSILSRLVLCSLANRKEAAAVATFEQLNRLRLPERYESAYYLGKHFKASGRLNEAQSYFSICKQSKNPQIRHLVDDSDIQSVARGKFYLQVGLYSNHENALSIAKDLKNKFYIDTQIEKVKVRGQQLYSVQIGYFDTHAEADTAQKRYLLRSSELQFIIKP